MASSKLRSSCSCLFFLLSFFNLILFILSSASIAPIILLKSPPNSTGWAFLFVSTTSLLSSIIAFYSHLTHFCFITHISLLITSSISQFLAIFVLLFKEKSTLLLIKSPRDRKEAMLLARLECGTFMAMFVMRVGVMVLSCVVHSCWVREYEGIEAEKEVVAKKRSHRMEKVQEESMANAKKISDIKTKEFDGKMKNNYGQSQWVKNEFEG